MHQTPVSLLERLKHPMDQEAWFRFVYLYSPLVFSWAGQVGLQEADAADLVQEVFILLLQKMRSSPTIRRAASGLGSRR